MKIAINLEDLNALISKYRRGDSVLWDDLVIDAEAMLYAFNGVGHINRVDDIIATGRKRITKDNRYPHTKKELAALFGVSYKSLYSWSELISIKRIKPSKRHKARLSWAYDARDILKQLERYAKQHTKGNKS